MVTPMPAMSTVDRRRDVATSPWLAHEPGLCQDVVVTQKRHFERTDTRRRRLEDRVREGGSAFAPAHAEGDQRYFAVRARRPRGPLSMRQWQPAGRAFDENGARVGGLHTDQGSVIPFAIHQQNPV